MCNSFIIFLIKSLKVLDKECDGIENYEIVANININQCRVFYSDHDML